MRAFKVLFEGCVQGVCFRKTVSKNATALGILGYVKNLENGSVEAVLQGSEEKMTLCLHQIQKNPEHATIKNISYISIEIQNSFLTFEVIE